MTTSLTDTEKLEAIYQLAKETHDSVKRMEATHTSNIDVLRQIELNTGLMARITQEQLERVTSVAVSANKNQVPVWVYIASLVIGGVIVISVILKDSNMDVKVPWLGIEISGKQKAGSDRAEG